MPRQYLILGNQNSSEPAPYQVRQLDYFHKFMDCIVCQLPSQHVTSKQCSCSFCYDCLFKWMEEQLSNNWNSTQINCLNASCNSKLELSNINSLIAGTSLESRFQDLMFKKYVHTTPDILACPNSQCAGVAFVPNKRCGDEFECNDCKYKWMSRSHMSVWKLLQITAKDCKSEVLTQIMEFLFTQKCPNCDSNILKNGGCSHMTCKKCQYYFCWLCKKNLKGTDHVESECRSRTMGIIIFVLFGLLTLLDSLGFLPYLVYSLYPIYLLFLVFLYNLPVIELLAICAFGQQTISQLLKMKTKKYYCFGPTEKKYTRAQNGNLYKPAIGFAVSLISTVPAYYLLLWLEFDLVDHCWDLIKYELLVGIVITAASVITMFLKELMFNRWLKYLI